MEIFNVSIPRTDNWRLLLRLYNHLHYLLLRLLLLLLNPVFILYFLLLLPSSFSALPFFCHNSLKQKSLTPKSTQRLRNARENLERRGSFGGLRFLFRSSFNKKTHQLKAEFLPPPPLRRFFSLLRIICFRRRFRWKYIWCFFSISFASFLQHQTCKLRRFSAKAGKENV